MRPEFEEHFQRVIQLEGGFRLHKNPGEPVETYAGIYRKAYPTWEGWSYIDRGNIPPTELVRRFYYENFYRYLEDVENSDIRFAIFEFAVNAGLKKAIKIAQVVVGTTPIEEARHPSMFVAGWRPAIGWIGAISLGYQFVLYPILTWLWKILQAKNIIPLDMAPPPTMEADILWTIVVGMIGIAGLRTYDKLKGVDTKKIR